MTIDQPKAYVYVYRLKNLGLLESIYARKIQNQTPKAETGSP